jgi:hypothetical protein
MICFFCQEEGTAMWASTAAVLYATIYNGYHEKITLIP